MRLFGLHAEWGGFRYATAKKDEVKTKKKKKGKESLALDDRVDPH